MSTGISQIANVFQMYGLAKTAQMAEDTETAQPQQKTLMDRFWEKAKDRPSIAVIPFLVVSFGIPGAGGYFGYQYLKSEPEEKCSEIENTKIDAQLIAQAEALFAGKSGATLTFTHNGVSCDIDIHDGETSKTVVSSELKSGASIYKLNHPFGYQ